MSGAKPTVTLTRLKPARGRNYRPSLTSSRKSCPNPNTPKMRVPKNESHLFRRAPILLEAKGAQHASFRFRSAVDVRQAVAPTTPHSQGIISAKLFAAHYQPDLLLDPVHD